MSANCAVKIDAENILKKLGQRIANIGELAGTIEQQIDTVAEMVGR